MLFGLKFYAKSIALFLMVVGLHHPGPASIVTQAREGPTKTCHPDIATDSFTLLAFLPCLQRADVDVNLNDTSSILEECDLLTRAAASLAIERWNHDPTTGNNTLSVASLSRTPHSNEHSAAVQLENLVNTFRALHRDDNILGVVGPHSSTEVRFWAPIFQHYNLLTVSYDVTNTDADQESSFYRTLPSDYEANIGRLVLMAKFEWFRIAVISSDEIYYSQAAKNFTDMYQAIVRQHDPNGELALLTTFSDSPDDVISEVKLKDFIIIFGYFGPRNARRVLCKANTEGLISNNHAWILPSYYNPNWWKIQDERSLIDKDVECSNEEMRDILESVIFIDTVKFPPTSVPLDTFHSQLVSKALDLFPSLTEEDLKPYLLRSRATNAYDAVTLLARSIRVAFEQSEGSQSCLVDTQVALERIVMYCEYCRLNSGCFLDANETKQCQDVCGSDDHQNIPNPEQLLQSQSNLLHRDYLLNEFGQILYSQFIEGEECPVAILWHSGHTPSSLNNLTTLDNLHRLPCAARLNISQQNFAREGSPCPQTFQWKGSAGPPRSSHVSFFRISVVEIVIIGTLTAFGFLIVVAFLILNIGWRNSKTIKATSPWLNVVFLVGVVIRLPTAMLVSLSFSTASYGFSQQPMKLVCNLVYWTLYIGEAVFLSALIMKNWRIYRLFHNKNLKRLGKAYSDFRLVIGILILQLPIVATLIVKAALFHARLEVRNQLQTETLLYVTFSFCVSDHETIFEAILMLYNGALLFVLFLLAFLNTLVHLSVFRREGVQSLQAAVVIFVPIVIVSVIHSILKASFQIVYLRVILWMEFILGVALPILTSALLFIPNVWLLVRRKRHPTKSVTVTSIIFKNQSSVPRVSHYHQLLKERETLKKELLETNEQISTLTSAAETQTHREPAEEEIENDYLGLPHHHHEPLPECHGSSSALIGPLEN